MAVTSRRHVVRGLVAVLAASGLLPALRSFALAGRSHTIEIKEFAFVPARLMVKPGDQVTWLNTDVVPHTATGAEESWDTGNLQQGAQATLKITSDMKADYYCRHHPSMVAQLVVE